MPCIKEMMMMMMMMMIIIIIITPKLGHSVHLGLLEFLYIATIVASPFAASVQTIITNT